MNPLKKCGGPGGVLTPPAAGGILKHFAFQTLPSALTAQVNCAYAYAAASHADAWLAEHFQKQNALSWLQQESDNVLAARVDDDGGEHPLDGLGRHMLLHARAQVHADHASQAEEQT